MADSAAAWPPRKAVCVGAVVVRGDAVLLVRQAKGASLEGQWSIPWGIVEKDETPECAVLRETFEEAGVIAEVVGLLGIQNLQWESAIAIVFMCRHVSGEPRGDGGFETDQAAYYTLADISSLEHMEPWCDWIVKRVLRGEHRLIYPDCQNPYRPLQAFL